MYSHSYVFVYLFTQSYYRVVFTFLINDANVTNLNPSHVTTLFMYPPS